MVLWVRGSLPPCWGPSVVALGCSGPRRSLYRGCFCQALGRWRLSLIWDSIRNASPALDHFLKQITGDTRWYLTAQGWWAPIRPSTRLWPQGNPAWHHFLAAGKPEPILSSSLLFINWIPTCQCVLKTFQTLYLSLGSCRNNQSPEHLVPFDFFSFLLP